MSGVLYEMSWMKTTTMSPAEIKMFDCMRKQKNALMKLIILKEEEKELSNF